MSDENKSLLLNKPSKLLQEEEVPIPPLGTRPGFMLNNSSIINANQRLVESRNVTPATYKELEYTYNEGYRLAKSNLTFVRYEMLQSERAIAKIKSQYLLDEYPEFIKSKKLNDNTANREAFLERQSDYSDAMDRLNFLKAVEETMENNIKVFENVCRYMRKSMDLIIRSGIDPNKY